jgi:hypothetical protein
MKILSTKRYHIWKLDEDHQFVISKKTNTGYYQHKEVRTQAPKFVTAAVRDLQLGDKLGAKKLKETIYSMCKHPIYKLKKAVKEEPRFVTKIDKEATKRLQELQNQRPSGGGFRRELYP